MYNYEQEYQKVLKETQDILDKAKQDYKGMKDKYNEQTLKVEGKQLVGNKEAQLMALKYKFLVEAKEQLEKSKETIIQNKKDQQAKKSKQDLILDLLQRQSIIEDFEASITLLGGRNCIDMLQEIQDQSTFNVCKAKLLNAVDENDRLLVQNTKYKDKDLFPIEQALLSIKIEDSRVLEPLLPPMVSNVEEYVTGNSISDTFFGGDVNA